MTNKITRLNERGLTLIELLAVIVILGIIAAIAIIAITNVIQNVKDKAFVGNALAIKEAAEYYIKQEVAQGKSPAEKLTYETLAQEGFINSFKDPDTGNYLDPSDDTYAVITGRSVTAVCLRGEKRSLCSFDGREGAIPISNLTEKLITENS